MGHPPSPYIFLPHAASQHGDRSSQNPCLMEQREVSRVPRGGRRLYRGDSDNKPPPPHREKCHMAAIDTAET